MRLAAHPRGGTAFKYILQRGTNEAKIYALVGLRRTNPLFFRIAVQVFRFWPGNATTFFGCIISSEPVRVLVATDKPNPVRLRQGQTLAEWWRHRPRGAEVHLDVIGGGYTGLFFEWSELTRPVV
jgi:hypothetical protein